MVSLSFSAPFCVQPSDEDEETRAYRLEIEKQKQLREKIMRDKEMKRRRAAEEKQHEVSTLKIPYTIEYTLQLCVVSLRSQWKMTNKFLIQNKNSNCLFYLLI